MAKPTAEALEIMNERFQRDSIIALATIDGGFPCVRNVNAYYQDGAFYVITHAKSGKMQQIEKTPAVAIAGEWFTARGQGVNMGCFEKPENAPIAAALKMAFAAWIDNGHNDFGDEGTIILAIRLTDGVLLSNGRRFDIDFTK